ncbi:MAG TPA: pyridoxamine 5'-phosphate oxidase family protein [Patescibacteria group bacterium]|nr:pyridoxamine 5'-phosphate oxidase family protein [Patescibacteria group bacterium]
MEVDVEKVIREYLPQVIHMSLGTSKDNKPWVCEVHFAWDDDLNVYFRSLTSRRHSQEIAENPNVAGNVVKQHQPGEYPLGVYFEGTAQKLDAGPEQQKAFECIDKRFQLGDKILEDAKNPEGHQFYKITVVNWYVFGKLDDEGGKKYKLPWRG